MSFTSECNIDLQTHSFVSTLCYNSFASQPLKFMHEKEMLNIIVKRKILVKNNFKFLCNYTENNRDFTNDCNPTNEFFILFLMIFL